MSLLGPISTLDRYRDTSFEADFLSGVAPSSMTFSRASEGMYWDADGRYRTAPASQPRFDFDPISRKCRGLLLEAESTNLVGYSHAVDQNSWTTSTAVSITPNYGVAPDGTKTSTLITNQVGNASSRYAIPKPSLNFVAGETYVSSCFVRTNPNGPNGTIRLALIGAIFGSTSMTFNTKTGSINFAGTPISYGVIQCRDNWVRIWVSATASSSGTGYSSYPYILGPTADPFSVETWGFQCEVGFTKPTSLIMSLAGTQATRARDTPNFNNPSWYDQAVGGTLYAEYQLGSMKVDPGAMYFVYLFDGSVNNRVLMMGVVGNKTVRTVANAGGSTLYPQSSNAVLPGAFDSGEIVKHGFWFDAGGAAGYANGLHTGAQVTAAVLPVGINVLQLFGSGAFSMHMRNVRFYGSRKSITTMTSR